MTPPRSAMLQNKHLVCGAICCAVLIVVKGGLDKTHPCVQYEIDDYTSSMMPLKKLSGVTRDVCFMECRRHQRGIYPCRAFHFLQTQMGSVNYCQKIAHVWRTPFLSEQLMCVYLPVSPWHHGVVSTRALAPGIGSHILCCLGKPFIWIVLSGVLGMLFVFSTKACGCRVDGIIHGKCWRSSWGVTYMQV